MIPLNKNPAFSTRPLVLRSLTDHQNKADPNRFNNLDESDFEGTFVTDDLGTQNLGRIRRVKGLYPSLTR